MAPCSSAGTVSPAKGEPHPQAEAEEEPRPPGMVPQGQGWAWVAAVLDGSDGQEGEEGTQGGKSGLSLHILSHFPSRAPDQPWVPLCLGARGWGRLLGSPTQALSCRPQGVAAQTRRVPSVQDCRLRGRFEGSELQARRSWWWRPQAPTQAWLCWLLIGHPAWPGLWCPQGCPPNEQGPGLPVGSPLDQLDLGQTERGRAAETKTPLTYRLSHRLPQNLNKECTWPGPACCPAVPREKDVEAGSGWWCRWAESPVGKPREDRATGLQQSARVPGVPSPPLWVRSSDSVKTGSCLACARCAICTGGVSTTVPSGCQRVGAWGLNSCSERLKAFPM